MSFTTIISAIGNNNSLYPLLVRDCGIEAPTKIAMTYNQNKSDKYIAKNALRERVIDEYGTSAVWLGGIPLVEYIADKIIKKKGYNAKVNSKLFKEDAVQGINLNIEKFKNIAPDAVKELMKVKNNKKTFEALIATKFVAAIGIPVALMGFILPKVNFAISKSKMSKKPEAKPVIKNNKNVAFRGNIAADIANMSTVNKMFLTDGGLTVGRVGTSRNKNESFDNSVKMGGMLFLNFVAPKKIAKLLDKFTGKLFNLNVNLDPAMLNDKEFISQIKNKKLLLPETNEPKDIIDFIDKNPKSVFVKFAKKFNKVKMLNETTRDPRAYVNVQDLANFKQEIEKFSKKLVNASDIEKFAKKAKAVKSVNIISNVLINSFLLAVCLPKVQFFVRKLITGSEYEPGLIQK